MAQPLQTPVALILYNRLETTSRVFAAIRRARPAMLLLLADGPDPDRPADADRCAAARAVVERVDWSCTVLADYADEHLGIKRRVDSGLDWLFGQVEEAIILEDDCLPDPSFFPFCAELLARYRRREQVMAISGNNFLRGRHRTAYSYHFSRYPLIWGWATWRRAWRRYDRTVRRWPGLDAGGWLREVLESPAAVHYWSHVFQQNYETLENWDYAWILSCWAHRGLSITPSVNLVSNIGFLPDATHTRDPSSPFANLATERMQFPLRHPHEVRRDEQADAVTEQSAFSGEELLRPMFAAARAYLRAQRRG
jgi:hypothetical protein